MEQLFIRNHRPSGVVENEELTWYYIQPAFKQLTIYDWLLGIFIFAFIVFILAYIEPVLVLESPWAILILPLICAVIAWFILLLKPHRQIFYRIDKFGIYSEFRQSTSPFLNEIEIVISLFLSLFGVRDSFYINKHSSKSREFEWKDIVSMQESEGLNKIVLQAGLKGKLYLFTSPEQFRQVLMLVTEYVNQSRKSYD